MKIAVNDIIILSKDWPIWRK